jgi:hypothetical protein
MQCEYLVNAQPFPQSWSNEWLIDDLQEKLKVVSRVLEGNNWTAVGSGLVWPRGVKVKSLKHILEYFGMFAHDASVNSEKSALCFENDIPVLEPELLGVDGARRCLHF